VQWVEFIIDAWSHLAEKMNNIQQHMEVIHLKEKEHPRSMLDNITQVVVEGDFVQSSLHDRTGE
jgi:hypothetical protein